MQSAPLVRPVAVVVVAVVIAAGFQRFLFVPAQGIGGHCDYRHVGRFGVCFYSPGGFITIDGGQLNVHQDEINSLAFSRFDPGQPIGHFDDLLPLARPILAAVNFDGQQIIGYRVRFGTHAAAPSDPVARWLLVPGMQFL